MTTGAAMVAITIRIQMVRRIIIVGMATPAIRPRMAMFPRRPARSEAGVPQHSKLYFSKAVLAPVEQKRGED